MAQQWEVLDHTSSKGGYLRLTFEGQRVCDFFPFAQGVRESWVRERARLIAETMNRSGDGEYTRHD